MKQILPKCSGATQMQGIFTSPWTTIILAPAAGASAVAVGNPLSNPLILPALPTFITLAAHQGPQPVPVISPLTKPCGLSSSVQQQCAPIAPKISQSMVNPKDQQSSSICIKGKNLRRDSLWKSKRKGDIRLNQKCFNFETPILPKRPQSDPQTVILLPSTANRKTSELPPSVLIPECSLVNTGSTHPEAPTKVNRISKNIKIAIEEKSYVKNVQQEGFQNKVESRKRYRKQTKSAHLQLQKKIVDTQGCKVDKNSKLISSHTDDKQVMRETSSFLPRELVCSSYLSESQSVSTEGWKDQSGHVPQPQDVPHHPPPPYPQDSVAKRVCSNAHHSKAKKAFHVSKSQKDMSSLLASSLKLPHIKKRKCEWKNASKISSSNAVEASPSLSSPEHSLSPQSKKRNIPPSDCESQLNHKCQSHHEQYSLPTSSSTNLESQASPITLNSSPQKKSYKYTSPLQPDSQAVCVSGAPTNISFSTVESCTQSVTHTSYCSQSPVATSLSPSLCSISSMKSEAHDSSSVPSINDVSSEPKSDPKAILPQATLNFNQSVQHTHTDRPFHLDKSNQAQSTTFYSHSSPMVSHSHPCNSSTETSFKNSLPSQEQTVEQKFSSYADSLHQSSFFQQHTSYTESPQLTSFKPSQAPFINTPQLPSYTQTSRSSHSQSIQVASSGISHHSSSLVHPLSLAARSHSVHSEYVKSPHSNLSLTSEQHASYLQPAQSLALSFESQSNGDSNQSSQRVSFSSSCTPPLHPSPQGQPIAQLSQEPSVTEENVSTAAVYKENLLSPIPPPYDASGSVPLSQYYADSPSMSYTPEKTTSALDANFYPSGKLKPSPLLGIRSLSPPSYEAHIQSSGSYISSDSVHTPQDTAVHSNHTNYSLSSQIVTGQRTQSLHENVKKSINSNCSTFPPIFSLPPPPRYNYSQDLTHEDQHMDHSLMADIAQETYNYDIGESSETYFSSTTTDTPLPLSSESLIHSQPPNSNSNSHISIHVTSQYVQENNVKPRQQTSQSRLLIYPLGRQEALCKTSEQDDLIFSSWNSLTQSTEQNDNLRVEKLWFIPHHEQNQVYMKESTKYLPNGQGLQSIKDLMLKKYWIEEDEPIAEEIISSLSQRSQLQEQMIENHNERNTTHPQPSARQNHAPKKKATRHMLCQICGKMLKGHKSLRSHLNSHYNIQPHSCVTCGKKFTNRSVLVEHLRIHSGETPYLCSLCSATFRTRSGLLKHKSIHSNSRPFECSVCSKKFKTDLVLQQHIKLHLSGVFTCSDCGKTFEKHRSLAVHKAFHNHKSQRYKCPHCPKGYHFQSLLSQHMQLHSNVHKHNCSVCGKSFIWRSSLVAHMKTHSVTRSKCDICEMSFASEKRLKSHYQRHTNQKPHQCKVCGRSFPYAYRLASHSVIHEQHKDYKCCTCDTVFTNAKKFRKHLVTHKTEPKICRLSGTIEVPKSRSVS